MTDCEQIHGFEKTYTLKEYLPYYKVEKSPMD